MEDIEVNCVLLLAKPLPSVTATDLKISYLTKRAAGGRETLNQGVTHGVCTFAADYQLSLSPSSISSQRETVELC
jgi:hypothetical protein